MKSQDQLLLNVWRETARHFNIGETTENVAHLVAARLPLDALIVRKVELSQSAVRTVAIWRSDANEPLPEGLKAAAAGELERLSPWLGRGAIIRRGRRKQNTGELATLLPSAITGDALLGPLATSLGAPGVLIAAAKGKHLFADEHVELFESLLEPFAAALDNDRRLHELATFRETAEADKRTLLKRLGRTELSDTMIGADSGLRPVLERVELVAHSDVPVLILGETGTGKEVIARAIHSRSSRAGGPFIRVNCGAIPPELIDSQLFGHERGSFTGASDTRQGWFERADGGTLFLDEIGELPLAAQVRFLRVLQDGFVERVGGHQSIHVNVRIVAATHRDLAAMVRSGQFREDLWYRVAVFPIPLPPLADRPEDIPALARHFAERAATRFGLALVMPTPGDLRLLTGYHWPGNIRELGAVIDRAALLGDGKTLEVATALGAGPPNERAQQNAMSANVRAVATNHRLSTLDDAQREHIRAALRETRGRIEGPGGAAKLLAINPHTLRARMRKLKIDWAEFRPV
jgi:transcriptional regulator with GAF, ATPase, and Fis domain